MIEKTFTHETPRDEVVAAGIEIGDGLRDAFKTGDYSHACSELIHMNIIPALIEISQKLSIPVKEIVNNRKYLRWFIESRPAVEAMLHALPKISDVDINIAMSAPIVQKKDFDDLPIDICVDFYMFSIWAIWNGAKPQSKREWINNKELKVLQKAVKNLGVNGILSRLFVSCSSYIILCDKYFEPEYKKIISGKDDRNVNSMADAFKTARITSENDNKKAFNGLADAFYNLKSSR